MGRRSIVEQYSIATMEKRIELILENLYSFERIIKGCEMSLAAKIYDEREYNRRKDMENIGIRVMSSSIGNPTLNIAVNREEICDAIRCGDWFTALKGTEDNSEYRWKIETISSMRTVYYIVRGQVNTLGENEYILLCKYFECRNSKQELADKMGVSLEALRARVYRVKRLIKIRTLAEIKGEIKCA